MVTTISTQNGSTVSFAHNRREEWLIEKENQKWAERHPDELRIDLKNGRDEILKDENLNEVYKKLFGAALAEWNEKQRKAHKPERVIKNYLSHLRSKTAQSKNAKKPVYEIIYGIGSQSQPIDENLARKILLEHYEGFTERNPNLYVVGAYLHIGSEKMGPHVHLDYVPVAECSRGMRVQNALTAALEQQGIFSRSKSETAQMVWQRRENEALEEICRRHGLDIIHPQRGTKAQHLTLEEYKLTQEVQQRQEQIEQIKNLPMGKVVVSKARLKQLEDAEQELERTRPLIHKAEKKIAQAQQMFETYEKRYDELLRLQVQEEMRINELANKKIKEMKKNALTFIKERGLWAAFEVYHEQKLERFEARTR